MSYALATRLSTHIFLYCLYLQYGRCPLHCTCEEGNPDAARILLKAEADVTLCDRVSIKMMTQWHEDNAKGLAIDVE